MTQLTQKPTNVRWRVFLALLILVTINYVDRAVISVLMPMIQEDLQFSPELVGVILSAFFWGYVVMQIPSGWLCDKFNLHPVKLLSVQGSCGGYFRFLLDLSIIAQCLLLFVHYWVFQKLRFIPLAGNYSLSG